MIRTIIVDDEKPARDELRFLLGDFKNIEIIGEADNGKDAIALITTEQPDLIFLDIQMRGLSGIDVADLIAHIAPKSKVIFATAYDSYALKAFELKVTDYVLKPIEEDRLAMTIDHISELLAKENNEVHAPVNKDDVNGKATSSTLHNEKDLTNDTLKENELNIPPLNRLAVEKNGHIILIDIHTITYITGDSGRLEVHTLQDVYESPKTLSELQERLVNTSLYRVHRSYIVNLAQVCEVLPWFKGTYWLRLPGTNKSKLVDIPVSKAQVKTIKSILGIK